MQPTLETSPHGAIALGIMYAGLAVVYAGPWAVQLAGRAMALLLGAP